MIHEDQSDETSAVLGSILRLALVAGGLLMALSGCAVTGGIHGVAVETAGVQDSVAEAAPPAVKPSSRGPTSYVVLGKRYQVKPTSDGHVERGLASWYGPKFHGRRTSSGERFDMYAMTAAHKTLPLATYAEVVNLQNGRSAVVKINDRGPFKDGRVVDLSYAAAKQIGVVQPGVAMVELRAIDPARPPSSPGPDLMIAAAEPPRASRPTAAVAEGSATPEASTPVPSPALVADVGSETTGAGSGLYLQVGAFGDRLNAEELRKRLVKQLAEQVQVRTADGSRAPLYKVHVGPLPSRKEARDVSQHLASLGLTDARVVRE